MHNAPFHKLHYESVCPNKVVFSLSNTISLLQTLDQGIIATPKAYYLSRTFQQMIQIIYKATERTILHRWKQFIIKNCVVNISAAWDEVGERCKNGVRKINLIFRSSIEHWAY